MGYIHQEDYQRTVARVVHQAKKSIVMVMYFVDYTKRGEDAQVVELVDGRIRL